MFCGGAGQSFGSVCSMVCCLVAWCIGQLRVVCSLLTPFRVVFICFYSVLAQCLCCCRLFYSKILFPKNTSLNSIASFPRTNLRWACSSFGALIGLTPQYCTCYRLCRCAIDSKKGQPMRSTDLVFYSETVI